MRPADGPCCEPAQNSPAHPTKRSPVNCCFAGAWCSAISLARESLAPAWRDLLVVLRRLEARGEIRGGRFVAGLIGEQFARPEAIDLLRAIRRSQDRQEQVAVSAADPLNLAGIILPGPRVSALSGDTVSWSASPNSPPPAIESYNRASMRTILITLAAAFSLAAADYKAGVGRVIITPEKPIYLSGYANRTHRVRGRHPDLWAKALAIEDTQRRARRDRHHRPDRLAALPSPTWWRRASRSSTASTARDLC